MSAEAAAAAIVATGMGAIVQAAAPRKVFDYGNGVECWFIGGDYLVYGVTADPRVAHSEGAAREIAAGAAPNPSAPPRVALSAATIEQIASAARPGTLYTAARPASIAIPAFDPDSPDAAILEASEAVRRNKVWIYSFDDVPDGPAVMSGAIEASDEQQQLDEARVLGPRATTPAGVLAQLTEQLTTMCDRWLDRDLAEKGLLSVFADIEQLDGRDQITVRAMHALLHMEWAQNLAAYEKSAEDFDMVLRAKDSAEATLHRLDALGAEPDENQAKLVSRLEAIEDRFSNNAEVTRLIRTLVPDHAAYLRKVEIIEAEGWQAEATLWLARDTTFLVGAIGNGAPKQGDL